MVMYKENIIDYLKETFYCDTQNELKNLYYYIDEEELKSFKLFFTINDTDGSNYEKWFDIISNLEEKSDFIDANFGSHLNDNTKWIKII